MIYGFLTRTELAEHLGITKPAITKAVKAQRLVIDKKTDKIDPSHPVNIRFSLEMITKGKDVSRDMREQLEKGFQEPDPVEPEEKKRRRRRQGIGKNSKAEQVFKQLAGVIEDNDEEGESTDLFDKLLSQGLLSAGDQLKAAQTTLANLRIAKEMGDLVVRQTVVRCFARLSGIMTNRLLCIGQRSAKSIASVFGVLPPEKEQEIREVTAELVRKICEVFGEVTPKKEEKVKDLVMQMLMQVRAVFSGMSPENEIKVQEVLDNEVSGAVEAIQREIIDATDW